jgi:hypothetical protein
MRRNQRKKLKIHREGTQAQDQMTLAQQKEKVMNIQTMNREGKRNVLMKKTRKLLIINSLKSMFLKRIILFLALLFHHEMMMVILMQQMDLAAKLVRPKKVTREK